MLLQRFSSASGQLGWKAFLRWAAPSLMVKEALNRIREFVERKRITDGLTSQELFNQMNEHFSCADLISVASSWQLAVTPDEWTALFEHLDVNNFKSVERKDLLAYVGSKNHAEANLEAKVRATVEALKPGEAQQLFTQCDVANSALVTREQFKSVLKAMRFRLFEEPAMPSLAPTGLSVAVPDAGYAGGMLGSPPLGIDSPMGL